MLRYYTVETRIDFRYECNIELREYLSSYISEYNKVYRYVWYVLLADDFKVRYRSKSEFVTHVCNKFNLLKRTVNSIRNDVEGSIKAIRGLKDYEISQLKYKVTSLSAQKIALGNNINSLKVKVSVNQANGEELVNYRKAKQKLYSISKKLNKARMKLHQLQVDKECGKFSVCFGTKKLYKAQNNLEANGFKTHKEWYYTFIKNRDKNIYYLGSKDETQGNQMLQLRYNEEGDLFEMCLRKENKYAGDCKYVQGICDFKYQRDYLISRLKSKNSTNTYRIVRRGSKWYLQAVIGIEQKVYSTSTKYGVIGLDYNENFIALSETDAKGNLVGIEHLKVPKGASNFSKSSLEEVISKVCKRALATGKSVVIEDLDFKKTKGKLVSARSKAGKKYNRMVHKLDYSRYKDACEGTGYRKGIEVLLVSPAYTSKIGKEKYAERKKLNVHQAASYVIARRGQGYIDKLIK